MTDKSRILDESEKKALTPSSLKYFKVWLLNYRQHRRYTKDKRRKDERRWNTSTCLHFLKYRLYLRHRRGGVAIRDLPRLPFCRTLIFPSFITLMRMNVLLYIGIHSMVRIIGANTPKASPLLLASSVPITARGGRPLQITWLVIPMSRYEGQLSPKFNENVLQT